MADSSSSAAPSPPTGPAPHYDVLVVGGGNAGLCAAIAARRAGATVLLLERAPQPARGGDSRHARNVRIAREPGADGRGGYPTAEFFDDLARVTSGDMDERLARILVEQSKTLPRWFESCGVAIESDGAAAPSRRTAFLRGGGKAMINAYYRTAERLGVDIRYGVGNPSLALEQDRFLQATAADAPAPYRATTLVVAPGGLQADGEWRRQWFGADAGRIAVRGTPFADGAIFKALVDRGAAQAGSAARCHVVAVDDRAPDFDSGIVSRIDGVPFGIVVDRNAQRLHDEADPPGPRRFAAWGERLLHCPGRIAYLVADAKAERRSRPAAYPPLRAASIAELALKIGLDAPALTATVSAFNGAIRPAGDGSDDGHTVGLAPGKSRLALPLDTPPFTAVPMRPGLTFSSLGLRVDESARVTMSDGRAADNIFAAGLIMIGNIAGRGYLAGLGISVGAVFGRIAGEQAARRARE